jgi:hypothetical protein
MAALPGYDFPQPPPEGFESWDQWADANGVPLDQRNRARTLVDTAGNRPMIFFNQVSESKIGKNRLHLDIKVAEGLSGDQRRTRIESEAARLVAAGAEIVERVDAGDGFWTVMRDVEGNEFCVI